MRRLRRWLQSGDLYHLTKLQRRTRPDQLSEEQLAASYRKPWYVRLHRTITGPFTWVRRRILDRVDPRRGRGERGRISDEHPEHFPQSSARSVDLRVTSNAGESRGLKPVARSTGAESTLAREG